jgi:hypothetical protein
MRSKIVVLALLIAAPAHAGETHPVKGSYWWCKTSTATVFDPASAKSLPCANGNFK